MEEETLEIVEVSGETLIRAVEALARTIWPAHYAPIIGIRQVEYMLDTFQSKEAIAAQIKDGARYYLLRPKGHGPVGYFAAVPRRDSGELFLSKLYLAREARRKGFARRAVCFSEGLARGLGLSRITLTVNKRNAVALLAYRRMGFKNTAAVVTDIGEGFVMDDFRMEKEVR